MGSDHCYTQLWECSLRLDLLLYGSINPAGTTSSLYWHSSWCLWESHMAYVRPACQSVFKTSPLERTPSEVPDTQPEDGLRLCHFSLAGVWNDISDQQGQKYTQSDYNEKGNPYKDPGVSIITPGDAGNGRLEAHSCQILWTSVCLSSQKGTFHFYKLCPLPSSEDGLWFSHRTA